MQQIKHVLTWRSALWATVFFCFTAFTATAQQARFSAKAVDYSNSQLTASFTQFEVYQLDVTPLFEQLGTNDHFHFLLELGNEHRWDLNLTYNDLRSPDYQEVALTEQGWEVLPKRRAITYAGYLNDQHPGEVRMSIAAEYLMGFVTKNGQPYYIEPLWNTIPGAPSDLFLVYQPQHIIQDGPLECGADAVHSKKPIRDEYEEELVQRGPGDCLEVDFLTAATFDMVNQFGSVAAVNDRIQTITNMVEPYYSFAFLDYVIVQQFAPATNGADPFTASIVAGDLLNSIESWAGGGGIATHDIGQLWVNRDIVGCNGADPDTNTSLIGCANIGVVCNSNRYNVCEEIFNMNSLTILSAHELGHNWDARHSDANGNDDNIMFPSLNGSDLPVGFGGTEQAVINAHVASRGCLSSCGTPSNDLCAGAITLGCGDSEAALTDDATATGTGPVCTGGGLPNNGVWFRFVGNGQIVTVSTAGSAFDTQLNVYEGSCGSLTCVAGDDDSGPGTTSEITFCALSGTTYYIYLDGFGGATGSYYISIACAPDTEDPMISCPSNFSENNDPGVCGADVTIPTPTVSDNCAIALTEGRFREVDGGGSPLSSWSAFESDPSGFFAVGRFEIEWRTEDLTGNDNECSFYLTVNDDEPPTPVCIDVTVDFNGEEEIDLFPEDYYDEVASDDNCDDVFFLSPASVTILCEELGMVIPVQVNVEDGAGNPASCTANVTVDGLPCGWMNTDGIGCVGNNDADYDVPTETFFLDSDGCVPAFPYTEDDLSFIKYELCGDGEIIAEVTDISGGQGYAGVMMRADLTEGAPKVSMATNRVSRIRREVRVLPDYPAFPQQIYSLDKFWVRIERTGSVFKGYASTDGVQWIPYLFQQVQMPACIQIGLVAYNEKPGTTITATYENVVVNEAGMPLAGFPTTTTLGQAGGITQNIGVFPNPAVSRLNVELKDYTGQAVTLQLMDAIGQVRLMERRDEASSIEELAIGQLEPGIYTLVVKVGDERMYRKVVIARP